MKKTVIKATTIGTLSILLCACNGFFDKDNTPEPTPLTKFTPEAVATNTWYKTVNHGVDSDYLKLIPAVTDTAIYTADKNGVVTGSDKKNGNMLWKTPSHVKLSAGPATNNDLIFIGSREGTVIALSQADGKVVWNVPVASEVLSPPTASNDIVLIKTIDGQLTALSTKDGHALWHFQQTEPALILRGGSAPQILNGNTVVGFSNGTLAKLTLHDGSLLWQQTVAIPSGSFAIQRMIDIDASPVIYKDKIYVATYQGRISALDLSSGKELWTHDISSYTGLTVDNERVYISDATSQVWAFDSNTGHVDWLQKQLVARNVTAPAAMDKYIVIGDRKGYLHWLNKQDGHFVARIRVNKAGMFAAPVVNNNKVYVLTKDGHLAEYTLG